MSVFVHACMRVCERETERDRDRNMERETDRDNPNQTQDRQKQRALTVGRSAVPLYRQESVLSQ